MGFSKLGEDEGGGTFPTSNTPMAGRRESGLGLHPKGREGFLRMRSRDPSSGGAGVPERGHIYLRFRPGKLQ